MIYLDADGCPVRNQVCETAARYHVRLDVVANTFIKTPIWSARFVRMEVVPRSDNAADDWIAARVVPGDLVITEDLGLVARVLALGARCLNFRGGEFSPGGEGASRSEAEIMAHLRAESRGAEATPAFTDCVRHRFVRSLDAVVCAMAREMTPDDLPLFVNDHEARLSLLDLMLESGDWSLVEGRAVDRFGGRGRRRSVRKRRRR